MTEAEHKTRYQNWNKLPREEKLWTPEGKHEESLLGWIEMINSCYTYEGIGKAEDALEEYITGHNKNFYNGLTEQEKQDIMAEHLKYLREHAEIKPNVFTDEEGCSYNNLIW